MGDSLIAFTGVLLNDLPYFFLGMALMWDYLRIPRAAAVGVLIGLSLLHAASITLLMEFFMGWRNIKVLHEVAYLLLYMLAFVLIVRVQPKKLLFMGFFVKLYADVTTGVAKYFEMQFWPQEGAQSFRLTFNLLHLLLLLGFYPLVWRFVTKRLRMLFSVESDLWNFLWLLPMVFFAMHSIFTSYSAVAVSTVQYASFSILVFVASLLMYNLVFEAMQRAQEVSRLESHMTMMDRQLLMQGEQYAAITQAIDETRAARHDLRHQLAAMRGYLVQGELSSALAYCEELIRAIPVDYEKVICDNFAVNAIALYYRTLAQRVDIDTDLRLQIPAKLGNIPDRDLCVVIGNLLENAIEACERMAEGKRFIRLRAEPRGASLFIAMDNSFSGEMRKKEGALLSLKHGGVGIGTSSIRAIADKYEGEADYTADGGVFLSSVHLRFAQDALP